MVTNIVRVALVLILLAFLAGVAALTAAAHARGRERLRAFRARHHRERLDPAAGWRAALGRKEVR